MLISSTNKVFKGQYVLTNTSEVIVFKSFIVTREYQYGQHEPKRHLMTITVLTRL